MQVFVVVDKGRKSGDGSAVYVFDNHDAALRCREDLKLNHWHLYGCSISRDWINKQPVRAGGNNTVGESDMSSFDAELRELINDWLRRGDDSESMRTAMQAEIERLKIAPENDAEFGMTP